VNEDWGWDFKGAEGSSCSGAGGDDPWDEWDEFCWGLPDEDVWDAFELDDALADPEPEYGDFWPEDDEQEAAE
jgi:hypothetical protein